MRWISGPARNQYERLTFGKPRASRISLRESRELKVTCQPRGNGGTTVCHLLDQLLKFDHVGPHSFECRAD